MCGIVGIITSGDGAGLATLIDDMRDTLVHRGPDEAGSAVLPEQGVALGMRRLSILDHAGGTQPMWDEARRRCVVFNGEIYNFVALRTELTGLGHRFASDHSDTEVLVHGYEEWGDGLFARLNGMFAFALWDAEQRRLVLARDRAGEKPLYVARLADGWAVASELKALLRHPGVSRALDPVALEQYLSFDFALAPRTVLEGVRKLRPGHHALLSPDSYREESYWTPPLHQQAVGEQEAVTRLDRLLDTSVGMRMVADVPVGLFLSGGLDSTTIGYYMRRHSDAVESFSIGFEETAYDETDYARLAARQLGTKHTVERLSQSRALEIVPRLAEILDEPVADQSILPTFLLSSFARRAVKVAIGGDGGDELFMGYNAYQGLRLATLARRLPSPLRASVARLARTLPAGLGPVRLRGLGWLEGVDDPVVHRVLTQLPSLDGYGTGMRHLLAPGLRATLPESVFDGLEESVLEALPPGLTADDQGVAAFLRAYLAEDVLVKVDRASMAASLEVRAPFLDNDVMDFLLGLPASLKLRHLRRKHLLRRLMRGRIPDSIIDRKKFGFNVPMSEWLRTALAPLVRDVLDPVSLGPPGIFDAKTVSRLVQEHLAGRADHGRAIWVILQFELWRTRWLV